MKKIINTILFILLFLVTKELVYTFYEDLSIIILTFSDENQYLKFSLAVAVLSFCCSFIFLLLYFAFEKLKIYWKIITYTICLLASLFLVNYTYAFSRQELFYNQIIINLIIVLATFVVFYLITLLIINKILTEKNIKTL